VIVHVIDIYSVAVDKAKSDTPVSTHANRPSAFAVSGERMQDQTGKINVFGLDRNLKSTQYQSQPLLVLRLYSGLGALEEETLKPLVSEASDHGGTVTRYATGYKVASLNLSRGLF
jgi:hypothetical protein